MNVSGKRIFKAKNEISRARRVERGSF